MKTTACSLLLGLKLLSYRVANSRSSDAILQEQKAENLFPWLRCMSRPSDEGLHVKVSVFDSGRGVSHSGTRSML